MFKINKNTPIPLYYQLKQMIKKEIERGKFKPGDRLPTEQELCAMFGISRTPVRQALTELTYEGILYRQPGLGTFVSDFSLSPSQDVMRIKVLIPEERWATPLEKAVRLWNEEHADRQIKLNLLLVGHPELHFKISTAVASGNAPDFSLIDSVWVSQFAKSGFLRPLDEIDPDWVEREYRRDFFPVFVEGGCCDGHVYAIQGAAATGTSTPFRFRLTWPSSGIVRIGSRLREWALRPPGMSWSRLPNTSDSLRCASATTWDPTPSLSRPG
jgi:DNA-binding transcriptional regulator YhcF (GntR family)